MLSLKVTKASVICSFRGEKNSATLTQHLGAPKGGEKIGLISNEYPALFYIRIPLPEGEEGGKGRGSQEPTHDSSRSDTVTIWW